MFLKHHAYYCDFGTHEDRCLGQAVVGEPRGWARAVSDFGHRRLGNWSSRSAILATSSAQHCVRWYRESGASDEAVRDLPVFAACGTGLGMSAYFTQTLAEAPQDISPEAAVFSADGPSVADTLRYSSTMLAGIVALMTGVRGENRTLTGALAGLLALRQAARYLASGRGDDALVVCGESLREFTSSTVEAPQEGPLREIGCAFLVSTYPDSHSCRFFDDAADGDVTSRPRFEHLEAASALASLCWALEQDGCERCVFEDADSRGRRLLYGIERRQSGGELR